MICLACKRRVDGNRSFCRNCGSSVFIEKNEAASFLARYADPVDVTPPAGRTPAPPPPSSPSRPASRSLPSPSGIATAKRARQQQAARDVKAAAASGAGCIAGLVRLAIFAAIIYYGGSALLRIPEVANVKDAIQRGDTDALDSALQALRDRFRSGFSDRPASDREAPGQPPQTAPSVPLTGGALAPALDAAQVYQPGNGVTMPTPTVRVNPTYTPEALRRRIQGSVLLECIVRPDFTVTDISIIRSLDPGLDAEAIKALGQWRFTPGRRDGRFVPVVVTIEMKFTLPES